MPLAPPWTLPFTPPTGTPGDPLANLGYEEAGVHPGLAADWTVETIASAELAAIFGALDPAEDWEGFEDGWGNDDYLFAFVGAPTDLATPLLDTDVSDGEAIEDFEEGWSGNEHYLFELSAISAAEFDAAPEEVEDFEEGWSNDSPILAFVGVGTDLAVASFDSAPEDYEDFEEGWSNDSYVSAFVGVGTDLSAASFDGPAPEGVEDFEEVFTELVGSADPSTNVITTATHGFGVGDRCTFLAKPGGSLPAGLSAGFRYYVLASGLTTTAFKVSGTAGGTAIDITDAGVDEWVVRGDAHRFWFVEIP